MMENSETELDFYAVNNALNLSSALNGEMSAKFNGLVGIKAFRLFNMVSGYDTKYRLELHDELNSVHIIRNTNTLDFMVYSPDFRPMNDQEIIEYITLELRMLVNLTMRWYIKQLGEPSND